MNDGTDQESAAQERYDCIVIGAGIAGASVASELASKMNVVLLERESQPGYHTTGRSAALYTVAYGPPVIRGLTRASGAFFRNPRSPYISNPLLSKRGVIFVARPDQLDAAQALRTELGSAVSEISPDEARRAVPILREGHVATALYDETASDIDVHALHQHYLQSFRSCGGRLVTRAEVKGIEKTEGWRVTTNAGTFCAPIVVNAAGAWADDIAELAGIARRGLVPKRRTALIVAAPEGADPGDWPMVVDVDEQFYLKSDAGKLLISPADEEPSPPCDAQPEEYQVALCIDRIERAMNLSVRRIENKWAGLRSFFPDGNPLATYDADASGFFWLAGQGGYGIQTAPALARAAAALVQGDPIPGDIAAEGVSADGLGADQSENAV